MVNDLFLSIGGFVIQIVFKPSDPPYNLEKGFRRRLLWWYGGFLVHKTAKADFCVEVFARRTYDVIVQGKEMKQYTLLFSNNGKKKVITYYDLSDLHFQQLVRSVLQRLLTQNNGIIFHASAVLVNGQAMLFLGKSGAGKSTSMRLLSESFLPLADDSVILRKEGKELYFYQTPFAEKAIYIKKSLHRYNLGAMFFLQKSSQKQSVKKISKNTTVLKNFIEQLFTEHVDFTSQMKSLLSFFSGYDNFYLLSFSLNNPKEMVQLIEHETKK